MFVPEIPNNGLKKEITEIIQLSKLLEKEYTFKYSFPATKEEIKIWEEQYNITIPESLKNWLLFSNGSDIRQGLMITYSLSGFIINCDNISEDIVIVGEVIGDGEYIGFSKKAGKILWIDHGKIKEFEKFNSILELIMDMM